MGVSDSWLKDLNLVFQRLRGAKSALGSSETVYNNKQHWRDRISMYEANIARRFDFMSEHGGPGQMDDWADENPEDATEWGISDSRTQPVDETYVASSDGPGGVSGNLDSTFSFDAPSTGNPFEGGIQDGHTPSTPTASSGSGSSGGTSVTGGMAPVSYGTGQSDPPSDTMRIDGASPTLSTPPSDSGGVVTTCLLYTSPSPRDVEESRMPSSA